ncbi:MAG: hypothetical protein MUP30_14575 [Deltaproteobacteria bacterium]|nr:hypothetical protein [Deltaproteobacteria bacterium]
MAGKKELPLTVKNFPLLARAGKRLDSSKILSSGQRATFGLTLALSRPHRKDGGIFDNGRGDR